MENRNIAILGCGYWGKNLIRCFDDLGALKYVYDINSNLASSFQDKYSHVQSVPIETIWKDPDIKGVVIATPVETHYSLAKLALENGKDIFVEKPVTSNVLEAKEIVELASNLNRVFLVGHILEYHPAIKKLRQFVQDGKLGKIKEVYSHRLNTGKVRKFENVWWSFAPHDILLILNTINSKVNDIECSTYDYLGRGIADSTITILRFENGSFAHIYVSWTHPFKLQSFVVVGTEGAIEFTDSRDQDKLKFYPNHLKVHPDNEMVITKSDAMVIDVGNSEPLLEECKDFLDCIKNRTVPKSCGYDGLRVVEILTKANENAEKKSCPLLKK